MLKLGCKRNRRQGGAIAFVITEYYERALQCIQTVAAIVRKHGTAHFVFVPIEVSNLLGWLVLPIRHEPQMEQLDIKHSGFVSSTKRLLISAKGRLNFHFNH